MNPPANLPSAITRYAHLSPDQPAAIFPQRAAGDPDIVVTYGELNSAARAKAAWLAQRYAPGDRALLLDSAGPQFLTSFVGCLYAGLIAVPAPTPSTHSNTLSRISGIALDCRPSVVLTEPLFVESIAEQLHGIGIAADIVEPKDTENQPADGTWAPPLRTADAVAFLQYTSGSTAQPRGVVVTDASLRHNVTVMHDRLGLQDMARFGGWLPLSHDMGLVGLLLLPLMLGRTTVLISPMDFLRKPFRWLELIDEHALNVTGAPNFAYELCIRRITAEQSRQVDLSRLGRAICGAEPVDPRTIMRFADKFSLAGLNAEALLPCYGMAEATLLVSGAGNGAPIAVRHLSREALGGNSFVPVDPKEPGTTLVGNGIVEHLDVQIVDPATGRSLPPDRIGEVWVRGASIAREYWDDQEASARTFNASTSNGDSGYLRTGDLGAWHHGQLFITGRIKDVVIVRGRNLNANEIERMVAPLHPSFEGLLGAVFSVNAEREEVVVIQEVRAGLLAAGELARIAHTVKAHLSRQAGVAPSLVLLPPGKVLRTTSGKVQRAAMRDLFLSNRLRPLHADVSPSVQRQLDSVASAPASARN